MPYNGGVPTIAFANQKGGVAKTTSVHAVATAFVESGDSVLLVDLDPQASLTFACGIDPESQHPSMHDVLVGRNAASDILTQVGPLHLLPSTIDVAGSEIALLTKTGREVVLKRALAPLVPHYDWILIDCGPSLGILTVNALTAAEYVIIPFQCESLSHRGVGQLLETVEDVRGYSNPDLTVLGGIATIFDARTKLSRAILDSIKETFDLEVLDPPIPKSVRVAESPSHGKSVLEHATSSKPATAYRALADSIRARA